MEKGLLYWRGRLDDQVKYRGYRVEPAEVAAALETIRGVERAAVLPRRDGAGQVRGLTAFLEGRDLPAGLSWPVWPACACPGIFARTSGGGWSGCR